MGVEPPTGVIHDIGYRRYGGGRAGAGDIRRALVVDSLRAAFGLGRSARSKVMPMTLLAVMCLPAAVIVAGTALTGADELVGTYSTYLFNLQLVVSVFVAAQAPALVSKDLRFGVMGLYFSRPLTRSDYVVGKFTAMTAALLVLTATPLLILFLGALAVGLPIGEQVPDLAAALAGAGLASAILAGLGLLVAALTPRRGFAVAAVIAVLMVLAGVQGVSQTIAVESGMDDAAVWYGLLSPYTLVDGAQSGLLGAPSVLPVPTGAAAGTVFVAVSLLLVVGSVLALLRRYRSVSVS